MDKIKIKKLDHNDVIILTGGLILFLPFWNNYYTVFVIIGKPDFFYTEDSYVKYLFNVFVSTFHHLKYPYFELIDLFILSLLPLSILFQIICNLFYNNKLMITTSLLCLMSVSYFIYFNKENLLFGCFVLFFQQLFILLYFSIINLNKR